MSHRKNNFAAVKKPENSGLIFKRLMKFVFDRYKWQYLIVIVCIIISALTSVMSSLFLKTLIDGYITPLLNQTVKDYQPLINVLFTMGAIYVVGIISNFIYSKILITITQGSMEELRVSLFRHMEKLPISYFDTNAHGDIMSVYTNDIDTLRQVISQSIPQFLQAAITIVSVFISMLVLSIPLTFVVIIMVFVMQIVIKKFAGKSSIYFKAQQKNLGKVNGFIEEMMEGQKVIKVFTHEEIAKQEFDELNNQLFESAYQANKYANMIMPILGNIGNLSYVFTALVGGLFAINGIGGLSLGGLASFLQLNRSFTMPISQISQQFNSIIMALAGADRIFKLLDESVEVNDGKVTLARVKKINGKYELSNDSDAIYAWCHPHNDLPVEYIPLKGDVRFDHVNFGYKADKVILHDISLFAKPGQKIAFVGATGAGKTTITNLINRFYDIQDGVITYDGVNIKLINKVDLRKSLGIVLQDTHLFTGTIRDNIRYAKEDASDEEVIAASKLANAHGFIKHLENGYDTVITNDGASLSQGQRQLLSIARAALANSPVLILDEATSSIDSRTEKAVQNGMDKLMEGRTVFVIAHRLSTIKNSQAIMVLEQGKIIERGDHFSLLKEQGTYYQLYTGGLELE